MYLFPRKVYRDHGRGVQLGAQKEDVHVGTSLLTVYSSFAAPREGRSNAHLRGDYQRIGDVMLKNIQGMKVSWLGWGRGQ